MNFQFKALLGEPGDDVRHWRVFWKLHRRIVADAAPERERDSSETPAPERRFGGRP